MKKYLLRITLLIAAAMVFYGIGRLYYRLTDGFTESNIASDFPYNTDWEVKPLNAEEVLVFDRILNQPFTYLGKGVQSYAFVSRDDKYVVKFFKYQRFRLQPWLAYFPPLPAIVKFRQEKAEKKWKKLDGFVKSWKTAYENLKPETGLIFVHLNKTHYLQRELLVYDKLGKAHHIDLDQTEFCIQRKAEMLCSVLLKQKEQKDLRASQDLIVDLLALILSEYRRGLADNDHALMQNTGVVDGKPIHVDVGQFVFNEEVKKPEVYHQELFTKTYKFKEWLQESYPELAVFLDKQLSLIIGPGYSEMKPKWREKK